MELDEEYNAKQRPKLELSMGPDGEVIFTEIPMERIAQEKFDTEFNLDWSDGHTSDDCEQNHPVTSTEINPDIFLVSFKDLPEYFMDSTKPITPESMPSTESSTQESDEAKTEIYTKKSSPSNANYIKYTSIEVNAQENSAASKKYEGTQTGSPKNNSRQSYCEKNTILNVISDIVIESNSVEYTANSESYSENSLTITPEGNHEDITKDIGIETVTDDDKSYLQESPKSYVNDDLFKEFIEADTTAYSSYQQESPKNYNDENLLREFIEADTSAYSYPRRSPYHHHEFTKEFSEADTNAHRSNLQRSPKSVNNDDFLKEFIEADAQAYNSNQQESPKNYNEENLLKEFIELSNVEPFVATGKNYTPTFIAKSGKKCLKSTKTNITGKSYTQDKIYCEAKPIVSKTCNNETSLEISAKNYSLEYVPNSEHNTQKCTKKVNIEPISQKSIETSTDLFDIESIPDIGDYELESPLKADDEALEEFIEASAKAILEPFMEESIEVTNDSMEASSMETFATPSKVFLEVPSPSIQTYSQETFIAKSGNESEKLVEASKKTFSEELFATTGKIIVEAPASPINTESVRQKTFITKSGNNSQKSVKASKKIFSKESFAATAKKFLKIPPSLSTTSIANSRKNSGKSVKTCTKEHLTDTFEMFSKEQLKANIETNSHDTLIAKNGNKNVKSVKSSTKTYENFTALKNGNNSQKHFSNALFATTGKMFLEVPPSSSIESGSQDPFIRTSGNNNKNPVKTRTKTLSKELFATTGKMFLELPPSSSIESGSQDTFISKSGNINRKSVKTSIKTKEIIATSDKMLPKVSPSLSIESTAKRGTNSLKSIKAYNKESLTATCKMVCEIPSVETYSQDTFIAKSGNTSQKSIDSSTKTLSKELFQTTGKMFLEVPPSPSFNNYSENTFTATTYSQKTLKTSPKTYTQELFTTTGKMFIELPPTPSIKGQENLIAKSENNHQKSNKASVEAYSKDPFIASYKMFLDGQSGKVKLENSNQVKSKAKNKKNCQKSMKPRTKASIKKPFIPNCKTFDKEPPKASVETRCQETIPSEISAPYDTDSPMTSNDYSSQLFPVASTEDCSLGSPISINESFCPDYPKPIIEESKLEWQNPSNLFKEPQSEWPNLSMDDISVNCGDNCNILDLQKCAKCSADLTDSQGDLHLCDPDKVLNASYEEIYDEGNEEPCTLKELTSKEKKKSKIDHRTLSGKYKKKYRYRPRPDFKKPYPKPCNKDCKTCHICNKEFGRQRLLLIHLRRHTDSLNLSCEFCEKKFAASYDLERHVKMVHIAVKKYSCYCSLCRIPFFSRAAAVDHQKRAHSHTAYGLVDNDDVEMTPVDDKIDEIFDIVCDVCGLKFCEQSDLDAHHIKSHTNLNVKPHGLNKKFDVPCDVCGLKFIEQYDLDIHIKKTHSVEIFSCETCGMKFNEKSDIDAHVKSHENQLIIQFYTPHKIEANTNVVLII